MTTLLSATAQDKIKSLQLAVQNMDGLAYEGLTEIAAIARLARHRLRHDKRPCALSDIAAALEAISGKADDVQNCIGCEAEEVGYPHIDEDTAEAIKAFDEERLSSAAACAA